VTAAIPVFLISKVGIRIKGLESFGKSSFQL